MLARELEGRATTHSHTPPPPAVRSRAALEAIARKVRADGIAAAESLFAPGINSYAAPVFDHTARVAFVITVIGHAEYLGAGIDTPAAKALAATAREVSTVLGYRPR